MVMLFAEKERVGTQEKERVEIPLQIPVFYDTICAEHHTIYKQI